MTHESSTGTALVYEDSLPLSCMPADEAFVSDSVYIASISAKNEELLHNILMLERHHGDGADNESEHILAEINRIDFKVNLLLDLVVELFSDKLNIPAPHKLSLSASLVCFQTTASPLAGSFVCLELFLNRRFPRPVTLYGHVANVTRIDGDGYEVCVDVAHHSRVVKDLLDKFIFLKHRRQIANLRQSQRENNNKFNE